ncbi:MAG: hypothetical protein K2X91_05230 [Thermoleophilia bacterium]|jgi:hypothetical protein|nr:hypothetical protein [Thermoleophilia bacterium]
MPFARVVSFEDVSGERVARLREEIDGSRPSDEVPATEVIVLHDPDAGRALVILFFETGEDYDRGDRVLDAMPAGETPGRRTSVARYEVALRRSA